MQAKKLCEIEEELLPEILKNCDGLLLAVSIAGRSMQGLRESVEEGRLHEAMQVYAERWSNVHRTYMNSVGGYRALCTTIGASLDVCDSWMRENVVNDSRKHPNVYELYKLRAVYKEKSNSVPSPCCEDCGGLSAINTVNAALDVLFRMNLATRVVCREEGVVVEGLVLHDIHHGLCST